MIALLLLLLAVCACKDERDGVPADDPDAEGRKVCLTLSSASMQSGIGSRKAIRIMGRSVGLVLGEVEDAATRALPVEENIVDFSLFLFKGDPASSSAAMLTKTQYISGKSSVEVAVGNADFLYVCVNVGDITGNFTVNASSYQNVLDAAYAVAGGHTAFANSLPMSGVAANLVGTNVKVPLTRMVAKITFNCDLGSLPAGDSFTITGAALCNVPKSVPYGVPNVTPDGTEDNYETYEGSASVSGDVTTYTWYMPENIKTSSTNVTDWQERYQANAPAYGTYISLRGDYTQGGEIYKATYVIYLGNGTDVNNYEVLRNHSYTVTSTIKGINVEDKRVTVVTDIDLSADGLANCYLASKDNQKYCFDATKRGNGQTQDYAAEQFPGLSLLPSAAAGATDALDISSAQSAKLIWETVAGVVHDVKLEDGYVRFSTGTAKGNALIGVYAADGTTVLWSWHIWRTNGVDLAGLEKTYSIPIRTYLNRNLRVMDRSLGSAFNGITPTFDDCTGVNVLYYQFGRKDPIPLQDCYSQTTGLCKAHTPKNAISGAKASLDMTIKEPWIFVVHANGTYGTATWIDVTNNANSVKICNCLWGDNTTANGPDQKPWGTTGETGKKTIYDPCPWGWRVSPIDTWSAVLTESALGSYKPTYSTNIISLIDKVSFDKGWTLNLRTSDGTSRTTYMAATGAWDYMSASSVMLYEKNVNYWESSPSFESSTYASYFSLTSTNINQGGFSRTYGFPIRCVQESSVSK